MAKLWPARAATTPTASSVSSAIPLPPPAHAMWRALLPQALTTPVASG